MKKNIIICLIFLISFGILIFIIDNNSNIEIVNNVTYALNIDGKTTNEFPDKGMYQVNVSCSNANGKWDYENWKLNINNITGNNISCKIAFNSISKSYLSDYITQLANTTQGEGKVISENDNINPGYDDMSILTKEQYGTVEMFTSSSIWDESGTSISGVFEFSEGKWNNVPSKMDGANTYYHIKFYPSSEGYYQLCYELPMTEGENIYIGLDNDLLYASAYSQNDKKVESCISLNYISNGNFIKIADNNYNNTYASVSFYIKKSNNPIIGDSDLRYEGKNPNNYIKFNNELWRIIGVFDELSHGQEDLKLVKIVREKSIGELVWDSNALSDWSTSTINKLLNSAYLNKEDGTNSGYCYSSTYWNYPDANTSEVIGIKGRCDYSLIGISDKYRKLIKNAMWHYDGGGADKASNTILFERSGKTTTGYIGLMYASDLGYSVLAENCARTTYLGSYGTANCAGQSWIFGIGREWLMSRDSNITNVLKVDTGGSITSGYSTGNGSGGSGSQNTYNGFNIRPTLYLNENVYRIGGDGSLLNPYIIAMDEA